MASKMVGTPKMIVPYEWILENVGTEPMTIASKMISFRGEKVFRVGLQNHAKSPILFFMAIELNKIGMEVEDVTYGIQGSGTSPATMMEIKREKEIGINGSLQLFKTPLEKKVVGNCTFVFRICIKGTYGYSYQLCDRLAKDQLWAAFKNHQHLADVVLIVKDKTFPAHKAILAARSQVFADEFEKVQPVKDVPHLQIRIDDVETATVEKFLHFIYTGEPMGTLADEELLKLADHYQLKTLTGLCQVALSKIETTQMTKFMASLYSGSDALSSSRIM
jgi:speckle-type POZ protein